MCARVEVPDFKFLLPNYNVVSAIVIMDLVYHSGEANLHAVAVRIVIAYIYGR